MGKSIFKIPPDTAATPIETEAPPAAVWLRTVGNSVGRNTAALISVAIQLLDKNNRSFKKAE